MDHISTIVIDPFYRNVGMTYLPRVTSARWFNGFWNSMIGSIASMPLMSPTNRSGGIISRSPANA
jgi:hypothetical protein